MTSLQLVLSIFSFLPFEVCLFWTICFAVQCRKARGPKRYFMAYIFVCTVLYLCHGLFFTQGLPYEMECLWTFCSLSVYPLFYGYLCRLTRSDYGVRQLWPWLMPGLLVAIAKYALPDAGLDHVRLLLFAVQIVTVCYFGIRMLRDFDRKLHGVYADTDGRDTSDVHNLLIAIIVVSVLSGVANSVGKHYFGESLWLLIPISLAFSTMLFALSYISFWRDFSIDQLRADEDDSVAAPFSDKAEDEDYHGEETEDVGRQIEALMTDEHYFLKHDLKISDIVKAVGSNRTHVSGYINSTHGCSFSDYMNHLRIEYAKQLLLSAQSGRKLRQIAEESGFANEQSFYRNFKKFEGVTPAEWMSMQQG